MEELEFGFKESQLRYIITQLVEALEPLVPYKQNPLEFSNLAHDIKNKHIENALFNFPLGIVNTIRNEKMVRQHSE